MLNVRGMLLQMIQSLIYGSREKHFFAALTMQIEKCMTDIKRPGFFFRF